MTVAQNRTQYKRLAHKAGNIVLWLAMVVALGAAWLNVQPFMAFVLWALPEESDPVVQFFLGLPVVGGVVSAVGGLLVAAAGVAVWGTITLIELFPGLIKLDRESIGRVIEDYRAHGNAHLNAQEEDPGVIQQLIQWHNELPAEWIKALFRAQSLAFCVDFAASFIYYYPLKTDLQVFLSAPSVADVDWMLVLVILLCVFTSNIILAVIAIAEGGRRVYKGHNP